ncbi:MAG: low-complexity protein [Pseudomonadota bacterium]|nr:low-complexity protein [Pseudomonadota bacterium]
MFEKSRKTTIAASMCTLLVGPVGVSAAALSPDQSPFVSKDLGSGYMVVSEGKCGEGKCGGKKEEKAEGKCGEGKCGGKKEDKAEGKCGGNK